MRSVLDDAMGDYVAHQNGESIMNRRSFFCGSYALAVSTILPGIDRSENMIFAAARLAGEPARMSRIGAAARLPGDLAYDTLISNPPAITVIIEGNLLGAESIKQLLADSVDELVNADEILITPKFRLESIPPAVQNSPGAEISDS